MPIKGVVQPDLRWIDADLRLRKYEGAEGVDFALPWYQDPEILLPMDGEVKPYSKEGIAGMYQYLIEHGEMYLIEYREGDRFVPIGDVTFWQGDMPITIGRKDLHGRGIGKKVVRNLIERGRELQLEAQNRKNNEYERHGIYREDQRSRSGFFQLCEQLFLCHGLTAS